MYLFIEKTYLSDKLNKKIHHSTNTTQLYIELAERQTPSMNTQLDKDGILLQIQVKSNHLGIYLEGH